MSIQTELDNLTGKSTKPTAKATTKAKAAKAQTPAQRKGFVPRDLTKALIAKAKAVWSQYQRDPKAPKVTERSDSWRRGPMLAVAYAWGFTSNADADAKVQAIQTSLGKPLTGPNGTMDFASDNPIKRQKCMGTTIAANWQARTKGKDGVYFLAPTTPKAKAAVQAIADQGRHTGTKASTTKAKASTKAKAAKPDASRTNGAVKVSVDQALRSSAKAAERAAQRKANRAKVKAEGTKAAQVTTDAQADA